MQKLLRLLRGCLLISYRKHVAIIKAREDTHAEHMGRLLATVAQVRVIQSRQGFGKYLIQARLDMEFVAMYLHQWKQPQDLCPALAYLLGEALAAGLPESDAELWNIYRKWRDEYHIS